MDGWKTIVVGTILAALFAVFTTALFRQDERMDDLRRRVTTLEVQHDAPPAAHSGPGQVPNPDRGAD